MLVFLFVMFGLLVIAMVALWQWLSGREKRPPSKELTDALKRFEDSFKIKKKDRKN